MSDSIIVALYFIVALLAGLTIHEASHAFVADRLGDPTARRLGRVTLNPIAHLDPAGTLMMAFAAYFHIGIGWGKPCPVNPNNLRPNPQTGYALVAAAGPVSNLLLATLGAIVLQLDLGLPGAVLQGIVYVIYVSVSLAVFNLIPIPPLDGFTVLLGLLPTGTSVSLSKLYQWGPGLLLLLVFFGSGLLSRYLSFVSTPILRALGVA